MPEFNLIQNPSLIYRLQRYLGLRQAHVIPTLNEGLQAIVIVGDARDYERGTEKIERPVSGYTTLGNSGVDNPWHRLANPIGSGTIIRLQGLKTQPAAEVTLELLTVTVPLATPGVSRFGFITNLSPSGVITTAAVAGLGTPHTRRYLGLSDSWEAPFVLPPGFALNFALNVTATGSTVTWDWTEEDLVQS